MHQEKRGLQLRNSADSAAPVPFPPMQQKTAPTSIVRPGDEKHRRSEMRERQQGAAPIYCKKRERGKNEAPLPKECFGLFLRCRMDGCRIPHPAHAGDEQRYSTFMANLNTGNHNCHSKPSLWPPLQPFLTPYFFPFTPAQMIAQGSKKKKKKAVGHGQRESK